jgi:hypothetical protein
MLFQVSPLFFLFSLLPWFYVIHVLKLLAVVYLLSKFIYNEECGLTDKIFSLLCDVAN